MIMSFYYTPLRVAATSENYFRCLQPSSSSFIRNRGAADSLDCCSSKVPLRPNPCGRCCCGLNEPLPNPSRSWFSQAMPYPLLLLFFSRLDSLAPLLLVPSEKLLCAPCPALQDIQAWQLGSEISSVCTVL